MSIEISRQNKEDAVACILKAAAATYADKELFNWPALVIAGTFAGNENSINDLELESILEVFTSADFDTKEEMVPPIKWTETG